MPRQHSIKIGDIEACIVSAGPLDIGKPENVFAGAASGCPEESRPHELWREDRIVVQQNVLVIPSPTGAAIFETGTGMPSHGNGPDPLHAALISAGFDLDRISAVLPTHAHLDHVGGIMSANGERNFRNASIHLHPSDVAYWLADERMGTRAERSALVARRNISPNLDRLSHHVDGQETFPGVTAMHTPGHTVGHTSFVVGSGRTFLLVVGDIVHHPAQLSHPRMELLFDTDKYEGVSTRIRVLEFLAAKSMLAFFYHFPWPGLGYVERFGDTFRFIPHTSP